MKIADFDELYNHLFIEKRKRVRSARVSSYYVTHEWAQNSRRCSVDLMILNEKKLILVNGSLIILKNKKLLIGAFKVSEYISK